MMMLFFFILLLMGCIMMIPISTFKFHPLSLNLMLLSFSIMVCLKMNFWNSNYWYSYILFLVMVGGFMILFMYFTGLLNFQSYILSMKDFTYLIFKILFLLMILYLMSLDLFNNLFNFLILSKEMFMFLIEFSDDKLTYIDLMINFTLDMNLYMIMYLFMTMICSVLICLRVNLPLRQFKKN